MKNVMYPITNNMTIALVEKQLKEVNPAYYIIFELMLETGIPLSTCCELKCCDIDKNAVTFHPTHKHVTRTEPISDKLQKEISQYLDGRNDMSYAFHQKNAPDKHLHYRTFLGCLESICEKCNINPVITSQTIRKTYIYRLFITGNNIEKIFALTGIKNIKEIYNYLGLPLPELKDKEYFSRDSLKDQIIRDDLISKTKVLTDETLDQMASSINYTSVSSYDYCRESMRLLTSINEAITIFNDETKNMK